MEKLACDAIESSYVPLTWDPLRQSWRNDIKDVNILIENQWKMILLLELCFQSFNLIIVIVAGILLLLYEQGHELRSEPAALHFENVQIPVPFAASWNNLCSN